MALRRLVDMDAGKKHTMRHHAVVVSPGDRVGAGDLVGEGSGVVGGELSLGKNLVVAYMPFEGYNYEDAIVLSKRCVREDLLTSVHVEEVQVELGPDDDLYDVGPGESYLGGLDEPLSHLQGETPGLPKVGTWVETGDVIFGIKRRSAPEGEDAKVVADKSKIVPKHVKGRVIHSDVEYVELIEFGERKVRRVCTALISMQCRVQVGDKLAGRHGNKGIVSAILDDRDMPFLPDGTPVDIVLNPLGVPSRMNVGQIFETLLGSAGRWTGQEYRVGAFDEMYAEEASQYTYCI